MYTKKVLKEKIQQHISILVFILIKFLNRSERTEQTPQTAYENIVRVTKPSIVDLFYINVLPHFKKGGGFNLTVFLFYVFYLITLYWIDWMER